MMTTTRKSKLGKLDISPELNLRFRKNVNRRFPDKKGKFKMGAEEAVEDWCDKVENQVNDSGK
jgi:hypothetical protein